MRHGTIGVIAVLASVVTFAGGAFHVFATDEWHEEVPGVLRDPVTGHPVPHARLYVWGIGHYDERAAVTTDDNGRFVVEVDRGQLNGKEAGDKGLLCRVLPFDLRTWKVERVSTSGSETDWEGGRQGNQERDKFVKAVAVECKSVWKEQEGGLFLVVDVPASAEMEVQVRAPDGRPLSDHAIELFPAAPWFTFRDDDTLRLQGKTDKDGVVRLRWPPGVYQFIVVAKGVGFGRTGSFELLPQQTSKVDLPRLAPFSTIEGRVDPKRLEDWSSVYLGEEEAWNRRESHFDQDGRFVLGDVMPGEYYLRPAVRGLRWTVVRVAPGEHLAGVAFPEEEPEVTAPLHPEQPGQTRKSAVAGRVADTAGRPVAGARVFVVNEYDGGMRMCRQVLESKTAEDGTYRVDGVLLGSGCCTVAAHVPGHPAAFARARGGDGDGRGLMLSMGGISSVPATGEGKAGAKDGEAPVLQADPVVSDQGGALDVRVLCDGKSAPESLVRVELEDWCPFFSQGWARDYPAGEAMTAFFDLLYPVQGADETGVARFENLPPGLYTLQAVRSAKSKWPSDRHYWLSRAGTDTPSAEHIRVCVAAGQRRQASVRMFVQPASATVRPVHPKGRSLKGEDGGVECSRAAQSGGWSSFIKVNEKGLASQRFDGPGLWYLVTRFRDSGVKSSPVSPELCLEGSAVIAVSALFLPDRVVDIHLAAMEPGSMEVQLQDVDGKPATGVVAVPGGYMGRSPAYAGTTDENGRIRFLGLGTYDYKVQATLTGVAPLPQLRLGMDESQLLGHTAVPLESVQVRPNSVSHATLRPQKVGYVRGKVNVPAGDELSDYGVWFSEQPIQTRLEYDGKTGDFLYGPVLPGEIVLHLRQHRQDDRSVDLAAGEQTVQVRGGEVSQVEITPLRKEDQSEGGPFVGWEAVAGKVLHADGKTPAYGARVQKYVPASAYPVGGSWSDAAGEFLTAPLSVPMPRRGKDAKPKGSPDGPVLVARLPGYCGATIVPLDKGTQAPMQVLLPPPISAEGRITVAGRPAEQYKATFHVAAAYVGKGKVGEAQAVVTTANHDGSFTLYGLTPGTYDVQAAMDDVWLSGTARMEAKAGARPIPVRLEIPEPGATTVVKLVDEKGRALPGREVMVDVPAGPLTEALRSARLRSDAAGLVVVDGVGKGKVGLTVQGDGRHEILVPSIGETSGKEPAVVAVRGQSEHR